MQDILEKIRRENDARLRAQWQQQQKSEHAAHLAAQQQAARAQVASRVAEARLAATAVAAEAQAARAPTAHAGAIAGWAQPTTLRSQFLLTEILKPPLSMRERR